jgi:hypothetical protein
MFIVPCFVGPCHHGMARPQVAEGRTVFDMEGSSSRGQPTRGGPLAWGLGKVPATPPSEKQICYVIFTCEMLPLETKESGGKILPHSVLRGGRGSVSRGGIMVSALRSTVMNSRVP